MSVALTGRYRTAAIVAAAAAVGAGLTVRRQAKALHANELAQQQASATEASTPRSPNLYVSVDRSGGGI